MWKSTLNTLAIRASGALKEFRKRPLFYSTMSMMISGSYILYDYASWNLTMWLQQNKIITTIRKGCVPRPPKLSYVCERNELIQSLYDDVLHPSEAGFFGVVVGPLGCGKTFCVTSAIRKKKEGVIYVDAVSLSCLAKALGKAAGMTFPKKVSLFEVIRSKTSTFHREPVLFNLPSGDYKDQIEYVLDILGDMAIEYQRRYKELPTLVIDSTDNIAKEQIEMFHALLKKSKSLVNNRHMNIVLVSSEGSVIPALKAISERSRCARIFRVPDVDDKKAVDILINNNCEESLAKEIAKLCDGRLILISLALTFLAARKEDVSDDDVLLQIKECLLTRVRADYHRSKIFVGSKGFEEKVAVLNALMIKDMDSDDILDYVRENYGIEDTESVDVAMDVLVKGNYIVMKSDTVLGFQTALHKTYWMKRRQYFTLSKGKGKA